MKILHTVQGYAPDFGGSEEVVKKVSEYLVRKGHSVTVATRHSPLRKDDTLNGVSVRQFACRGNSVEGITGDAEAYRDFVRTGDFDIMMNYAAQVWTSDLLFDLLPSLRMKKVFIPCGFSRLNDPLFGGYFGKMPGVLRAYDRVIYHAPNYIDAGFARRHGIGNGIVIPNGADADEFTSAVKGGFRKKYGLGDGPLIINVSNHSTLKNHRFFWNCASMLKGESLRWALIGNAYDGFPRKWLRECYSDCRVRSWMSGIPMFAGLPRAEVVQAYTDADIFLFGSRVECSPLVMFEAMASRTLFISTDCGNVSDYKDVVCLMNDEHEAAGIIRDYLARPELYRQRVEAGYRLFTSRLNWDSIGRMYEELYGSLVGAAV
jgi:L-malate glycosyltransferase